MKIIYNRFEEERKENEMGEFLEKFYALSDHPDYPGNSNNYKPPFSIAYSRVKEDLEKRSEKNTLRDIIKNTKSF